MPTPSSVKPTPFTPFHRALGARLVGFAGFEMPLRYTGDVREHLCVRNAAGVFDITHMGEYHVAGPGAGEFVHRMVTNDVLGMEVGQAIYTAMCRPDGGIVDDLLVYRLPDRWMLVVNGATNAKDFAWLAPQVPAGVEFRDISEETALLAVQGPHAERVLRGDIRWAALGRSRSSRQAGSRPVLVLSEDVFNERSGTAIAVALTRRPQRAGFPLTVEIRSKGLERRSWAKIGQVRTLSVERLGDLAAVLSPEELALAVEGLNEIVGD